MAAPVRVKRFRPNKWKAFEGVDKRFLAQVVTLRVCGESCLVVTKDDSVYFIDEDKGDDELNGGGDNAGEGKNKKSKKKKKKRKRKKRITKMELLCGRRVTGFACGGGLPVVSGRGSIGGGGDDDVGAGVAMETGQRRMTALDSWTKNRFYIALTEAGDIFTWGANNQGQLGRGGSGGGEDSTPARILSLSQETIVEAAAGAAHAIALTSNGKVYGWGLNECGECGTDRRVVAHFAPCEVWFGGQADCSPRFINQPDQSRHARSASEPPSVIVTAIACGASHSAAITSTGQVYCWGRNDRGQLGTGDREHRWRPRLVAELGDTLTSGIACGSAHTAALSAAGGRGAEGGVVSVWGDNADGRLATITRGPDAEKKAIVSLPAQVKRLHRIEAIFSTYDIAYTVAVKKNSTFVWGYISDKKLLSTPKKKPRTLLEVSYRMAHTPCFTVR